MRSRNLKPIPIPIIIAAMSLASSQLGMAALVTPSRGASVVGCVGGAMCSVLDFIQDAGSGVAQLNVGTYGSTAAGVVATVSAIAQASFGVMRGASFSSFNITATNLAAGTLAQVGFTDIITISFAPWNGQQGLLGINYTLD